MKEELLEAIYGTVERLEQKVDELSASPKNAEAGSIPVPVSVDTCKLEKDILSIAVKEGESIDNSSLKFEIMAKQLYVASQRVL